ncbi:hypothetical protein D3C72_1240430 [compost metagenome]
MRISSSLSMQSTRIPSSWLSRTTGAATWLGITGRVARLRVMANTDPAPGQLRRESWWPSTWEMPRAMASPRPSPCSLAVRE